MFIKEFINFFRLLRPDQISNRVKFMLVNFNTFFWCRSRNFGHFQCYQHLAKLHQNMAPNSKANLKYDVKFQHKSWWVNFNNFLVLKQSNFCSVNFLYFQCYQQLAKLHRNKVFSTKAVT